LAIAHLIYVHKYIQNISNSLQYYLNKKIQQHFIYVYKYDEILDTFKLFSNTKYIRVQVIVSGVKYTVWGQILKFRHLLLIKKKWFSFQKHQPLI